MFQIFLLILGLLLPFRAGAVRLSDYYGDCSGFLYCDSGTDVISIITFNVIATVATFIVALAIIACFYGAIRMIVSQGQEGKEAGKKALIWAAAGLAGALLVRGIIDFVWGYLYLLGG